MRRNADAWMMLAFILFALFILLWLSVAPVDMQAQAFNTNTPAPTWTPFNTPDGGFRMQAPTQYAPSATAASVTLTARAATPTPIVQRGGTVEAGRVVVCLFCVVIHD